MSKILPPASASSSRSELWSSPRISGFPGPRAQDFQVLELLEAPRSSWKLLDAAGSSWALLEAPGSSWMLLEAPGRCWKLQDTPGCSWMLREAQLNPAQPSSTQLSPSQPSSAQLNPAQPISAQPSPALPSSVQLCPAQPSSSHLSPGGGCILWPPGKERARWRNRAAPLDNSFGQGGEAQESWDKVIIMNQGVTLGVFLFLRSGR